MQIVFDKSREELPNTLRGTAGIATKYLLLAHKIYHIGSGSYVFFRQTISLITSTPTGIHPAAA
jgi:hypothetical protein